MELNNILSCKNSEEFREWLEIHHKTEKECYIQCKRGKITSDDVFYYIDAVYVALSFGWIDSTVRKKDGIPLQRFSPRRKNSNWTELNKERCRWLIKNNLMTSSGFKTLPDLEEKFQYDKEIIEIIKKDKDIYNNFNNFPDLYKRIKLGNIQKEKKNIEVFNRMLNNFLKKTKENKLYGDWNDNGRLI